MRYLSLLIIIGPFILEFLIFSILADIIGFILTISLSIFTSLLGILILRFSATSISKIKDINFGLEKDLFKNFYSDMWNLVGGLLLILPGFFTDLIGVLITFSFTRRFLIKLVSIFIRKSRHIETIYEPRFKGPIIDASYEDLTKSKDPGNKKILK